MYFEICMICSIVFVVWIIGRLLMLFDIVHVPKKQIHIWRHVKQLNQACYCSICEIMLTASGFYCEACGICSDTLCIQTADKVLKCKTKSIDLSANEAAEPIVTDQQHLWVKGNLTQQYVCYICERDIDYHGRPGLYGYRCCWCQRATHINCFIKTADDKICDFGPFKDVIIPPSHTFVKHRRLHQHITNIITPEWPDWKPLIIVANSKSGDNTAENVIAVFRSVLNPIQIFELSSSGPKEALNLITKIRTTSCRILVAGGDGTIGWILNEIARKNIKPIPEVCILPVGTGNDLSRVLGWGAVPPALLNPSELCDKVRNAEPVLLDRWLVDIQSHTTRRLHINWLPHRKLHMYNYFSVGVDAQVTLNFHKARESPLYMISSRVFNKLLYLCFGTQQVVLPDCVGLEQQIHVYLDDVKVDLPELQAVVCLNIDSWGAGVHLWDMSGDGNDRTFHSISDGVIEVIGIVSSFHMAQLQVGLNRPIRLGQAKNVRIQMLRPYPVQADGEPWIQSPCEISISCYGQAKMLQCSSISSDNY